MGPGYDLGDWSVWRRRKEVESGRGFGLVGSIMPLLSFVFCVCFVVGIVLYFILYTP